MPELALEPPLFMEKVAPPTLSLLKWEGGNRMTSLKVALAIFNLFSERGRDTNQLFLHSRGSPLG